MNTKRIRIMAAVPFLALIASCNSMASERETETSVNGDEAELLFNDPMTENWQEQWFLDGERATLEHRNGGLAFLTEYTVNKNVDRAGFDAQHAVLWTRPEFEGDIRISYTYTKLPGCSWQKLIYVHAQGIGEGPHVEDIYAWRELREVAVMSAYFKYMDLIGFSIRDQIRCRRYPIEDSEERRIPNEFKPRGANDGLPIGHELQVVVEKREQSIRLSIKDVETGEYPVDHTWDLTDEAILENREPLHVEKGRIGIRQMGGHKILMRDFKVERL